MKLLKFLVAVLMVIGMISCATQNTHSIADPKIDASDVSAESDINVSESQMVGGWAPAFFSVFNKKELQDIVDGINEGRVKKATISYPTQMSSLAVKIRDYLQAQTNSKIQMEKVELANTDTVTYNMKQVVVTLYFGSN